jgi:tetratricopeptide (TPR) repeat protein
MQTTGARRNLRLASETPAPVPEQAAPPASADSLVRDGVGLYRAHDTPGAIACYEAALALAPEHFDALNNLGVALRAASRLDEAIDCLTRAAAAHPLRPEGHFNLGNALTQAGRIEAAAETYLKALARDPAMTAARAALAGVYRRLNRPAEEIAAYQALTAAEPQNPEWWNNLGAALFAHGKMLAALPCLRRAVALRPGFAKALKNLGVVLTELDEYDEATVVLAQAVAAEGGDAATLSSLGQALVQAGDATAAADCFQRAIELDPAHLDARLGRSRAAFLAGDLSRAWEEYEHRWKIESNYPAQMAKPAWNGEDLNGKTLLVWAEQGLGDTLQFVRYTDQLAALGARVLMMVQEPVVGIVRTAKGVAEVRPAGPPPADYDFHIPLLSVPRILGTRYDDMTRGAPYLSVPPGVTLPEIPGLGGQSRELKIGIVWAGNPTHKNDRNRSTSLGDFLRFCGVPGARFFSLQKGAPALQLAATGADSFITDLSPHLATFNETAAIVDQLDLVISVDTSIVHLTGALGRPVWCLLPFAPDWRWLLRRDDTPWYPSMRLFRQGGPGQWCDVFETIRHRLSDLVAMRGTVAG